MAIITLFFSELFVLFLLSRLLQKKLSLFFFLITKNLTWTVRLLALFFLPGTLIHEVAHALMAHILLVPVGNIKLMPKLDGKNVKLGSVAIEKTDPFRSLLIGVAPFLFGTSIILTTLFLAEKNNLWGNLWTSIATVYIIFETANSMFSSRKDLEGALLIVFLTITLLVSLFLLGISVSLEDIQGFISQEMTLLFYQGTIYLLFPLTIDAALITILSLFIQLLRK